MIAWLCPVEEVHFSAHGGKKDPRTVQCAPSHLHKSLQHSLQRSSAIYESLCPNDFNELNERKIWICNTIHSRLRCELPPMWRLETSLRCSFGQPCLQFRRQLCTWIEMAPFVSWISKHKKRSKCLAYYICTCHSWQYMSTLFQKTFFFSHF